MKRKSQRISVGLFLLVCLTMTACLSQKYTKKAIKYEQMGFQAEAAEFYYQALMRKSDNIEAMLGLKRTGQTVLDEKLRLFEDAYNQGDNTQAVQYYQKANLYYQNLEQLGIDLRFPSQYRQYYEEAKSFYLEEQYLKAIQLLKDEYFTEAVKLFDNILSYASDYRDSRSQRLTAICEPQYRTIVQLMDNRKYRTAYAKINILQNTSSNYKDVQDLKEECLERGSVLLIVPKFANVNTPKNVSQALQMRVMRSLQEIKSPFLTITENTTTTATAAQIILLNGNIQSLSHNAGKLTKTETKGWLKKTTVDKKTDEKKVSYEKVYYYVYQQNSKMQLSLNYQITHQRTKEMLKSNAQTFTTEDAINYATYDGNKNDLVPGYWKHKISLFNNKEDYVEDNFIAILQLRNLLNARRSIKSYDDMLDELLDEATQLITQDLKKYLENE